MIANRILNIAISISSVVVIPVQLVTTLLLSILVNLTFGLLLIPLSLIWAVCFLGPLLSLSWLREKLWAKSPVLKIPLAVVGIPLAFVGNIYVCLIPSMGELDSRISKLLLTQSWPYTLNCWRLMTSKLLVFTNPGAEEFGQILTQFTRVPPYREFLENLDVDAQREVEILMLHAREERASEELECDDGDGLEILAELKAIRREILDLSMISVNKRRERTEVSLTAY